MNVILALSPGLLQNRTRILNFMAGQVMKRIRPGMLAPSSNTALEPLCAAIISGLSEISVHFSRFRVTQISLAQDALGRLNLPQSCKQRNYCLTRASTSSPGTGHQQAGSVLVVMGSCAMQLHAPQAYLPAHRLSTQ